MTTDNELAEYLLEEVRRLKAEVAEARQSERELLGLLGLLREGVGALWIVCAAALHESDCDDWLPTATYEAAIADVERRLKVVNEHFGHRVEKPE